MTATLAAGLTGYLIGFGVGLLVGLNRAGRAYDRGQADLLEQQSAVGRSMARFRRAAKEHRREGRG